MVFLLLLAGNAGATENQGTAEDSVYTEAEVMPEFPGGFGELQKFILTNLVYPEKARKDSIQGKVFVRFTVDESGRVGETQVARGVDPLLDREAARVVELMPVWRPGKIKEKPVKVQLVLPVAFVLQ